MNRAVRFYRDVIGLTLTLQTEGWSELNHDGAVVALHGGHDGSRNATGLSLQVDDVTAAVAATVEAGATLERGPAVLDEEGITIADLVDPEGNVIMITETKAW
jgi:predicted enzyme related to lactoylglutathione lyase